MLLCLFLSVPGKPTMIISTTVGNTALIQWQPPKETFGELLGFRLQYKRQDDSDNNDKDDNDEGSFITRHFMRTDDHFTVTGLLKGSTYSFRLSAKNRAGHGEEHVKEVTSVTVNTGLEYQ